MLPYILTTYTTHVCYLIVLARQLPLFYSKSSLNWLLFSDTEITTAELLQLLPATEAWRGNLHI